MFEALAREAVGVTAAFAAPDQVVTLWSSVRETYNTSVGSRWTLRSRSSWPGCLRTIQPTLRPSFSHSLYFLDCRLQANGCELESAPVGLTEPVAPRGVPTGSSGPPPSLWHPV
jgi:hypothetical protein